VAFAAQHFAQQPVLATSKRCHSALPASHDNKARKAFARIRRTALPNTHKPLERVIALEAREHTKREDECATREHADISPDEPDSEPMVETEG
jgi:hypothetical protein